MSRHPDAAAGRALARRARALLLLLVLTAIAVPATDSGSARAAPLLGLSLSNPTRGPLGAVSVVGDSVLMGAGLYSPTLLDQLVANGWGPVRYRATLGMSTGKFNVTSHARASWWIQSWRNEGWDAPTVIVNVGSNDQGLCNGSYQCAYDSVTHLVDTIGPNRQIWWPLATAEPRYAQRVGVWNSAVRAVASERANVHAWDWPRVMATEGYASHDNIHLSPDGYRKRSARMAQQLTIDLGRARRTGKDAALPSPTAAASRYRPLAPQRITDTREDAPGRRGGRSTMRVDFGSAIPPDATAVAVNVTAAGPAASGFLRAFPCGGSSAASTVNYTRGRSRGAMTITPLGTGDDICIYAHTATDVVVDLQGVFFTPTGSDPGAGFTPRATPKRLRDTRTTGRSKVVVVPTPANATAVAVNLTAVNAANGGWIRAYPCDGGPTAVSNLNFGPGEAVAGGAFVPTSANDTICVTSNRSVDVVVDLTGVFTAGGLSFRPTTPTRMVDTRDGTGGWSPIMGADQTIDIRVAPAGAEAVTGTVAMIRPYIRGFVTAYGCGTRPATSSVNSAPGIVLANSITTGISAEGRLCLYSSRTSQLIFDTTGWWVS